MMKKLDMKPEFTNTEEYVMREDGWDMMNKSDM